MFERFNTLSIGLHKTHIPMENERIFTQGLRSFNSSFRYLHKRTGEEFHWLWFGFDVTSDGNAWTADMIWRILTRRNCGAPDNQKRTCLTILSEHYVVACLSHCAAVVLEVRSTWSAWEIDIQRNIMVKLHLQSRCSMLLFVGESYTLLSSLGWLLFAGHKLSIHADVSMVSRAELSGGRHSEIGLPCCCIYRHYTASGLIYCRQTGAS